MRIQSITAQTDSGFIIETNQGTYQCESLVVATGGVSIPTLGGSGIGYEIAKQFGHRVYPTRAGLVPFTFSDSFKEVTTRLSGNAVDVTLSNLTDEFYRSNGHLPIAV